MNTFINTYLKAWRQYAVFTGRSTRSEYWVFTLVNSAAAYLIAFTSPGGMTAFHQIFSTHLSSLPITPVTFGPVVAIYWVLTVIELAALIPTFAVMVRRFHDLGHSGWWWLLGLIPVAGSLAIIVWFCFRGTPGSNRFGPDPLVRDGDAPAAAGVDML